MMKTENEFINVISHRFMKAFERIKHAVNQLDDQQVWYRPSRNSNSIGIIIQHILGNLHQWVCAAIGDDAFQRNRPQEFIESDIILQKDILLKINALDKNIQNVILRVKPESLLSARRIQGYDETVMSALLASLTHLELHGGQITFLAKLMLDNKYLSYWHPLNKEQGKD